MSILKNRKDFKDSKKTQKLVKIGKNLTLGDGGLAGQNIYPTPDGIPKNL